MLEREVRTIGDVEVELTPADGRPLMILTRMAARGAGVWDGIWDRLCAHFTVANFGLALPERPHIDRMGDLFRSISATTAEVADGLGYDRFHMFGWAGGTHVALRCAADHRDRVASVTLLGAFHPLPDMRMIDKQLEFRRVMLTQPDRELYCYYWYLTMFTPEWSYANFDRVQDLASRRARVDGLLARAVDDIMEWDSGLYRQWVDDAALAGIRAPVHLVGIDANINNAGPTIEMSRILHRKIPGSRLSPIPGARAMILQEDPAAFMAVGEPFFREMAARPG